MRFFIRRRTPAGPCSAGEIDGEALGPLPRPRPGIRIEIVWLWAVLLALSWHLAWSALLRPVRDPRGIALAAVPRMTWVSPAKVDPAMADVRSPVLFSLPTAAGFSAPVLTNGIVLSPPIGVTPSPGFLLARRPAPDAAAMVMDLGLTQQVAAAMRDWREPERRSDLFPAPSPPAVQVLFSPGLEQAGVVRARLPEGGAAPWEAQAFVEFDADGRAVHVLIESPAADTNVNVQVARALRAWRLERGGPASGRVVLRWAGRAASGGEEPRP